MNVYNLKSFICLILPLGLHNKSRHADMLNSLQERLFLQLREEKKKYLYQNELEKTEDSFWFQELHETGSVSCFHTVISVAADTDWATLSISLKLAVIFAVISGDKQNWRFQVVVTACCCDADSLQRLSFRHRELAAVWLVCCVSTDRYEEGDMMICDTDSCFTDTHHVRT